jgi:hypothetical protein
MSTFEDVVSILRTAERLVIGADASSRWKPLNPVIDSVLRLPWFILAGMTARFRSLLFALALLPVWWLICQGLIKFSQSSGHAEPTAAATWWLAALFALGSLLFRIPSRVLFSSLSATQIDELAAYIRGVASKGSSTKHLQSAMDPAINLLKQRASRTEWLLGAYWAVLLWVWSKWSFVAFPSQPSKLIIGTYQIYAVGIFLFIWVGAVCYETALRKLTQLVEFAFLEATAHMHPEIEGRKKGSDGD